MFTSNVAGRSADFPGVGFVYADRCGQELLQLCSAVKSNDHLCKGRSYDPYSLRSLRSLQWNENFGREEICRFMWLLNTNWFWCWHWFESLISLRTSSRPFYPSVFFCSSPTEWIILSLQEPLVCAIAFANTLFAQVSLWIGRLAPLPLSLLQTPSR